MSGPQPHLANAVIPHAQQPRTGLNGSCSTQLYRKMPKPDDNKSSCLQGVESLFVGVSETEAPVWLAQVDRSRIGEGCVHVLARRWVAAEGARVQQSP